MELFKIKINLNQFFKYKRNYQYFKGGRTECTTDIRRMYDGHTTDIRRTKKHTTDTQLYYRHTISVLLI